VAYLFVISNGVRAQVRSTPSDSAYAWLLLENTSLALVEAHARAFDPAFYKVFIESTRSEDSVIYRLLLGRYNSPEEAHRDDSLLPLPERARTRLVRASLADMKPFVAVKAADRTETALPAIDQQLPEPYNSEADTTFAPTAERGDTTGTLRLFIDCFSCGSRTARREIKFVDHVRDPSDADVHLLVTQEQAAVGKEYTINFMGRGRFEGVNDTLYYVTQLGETDDTRRRNLVRKYKLGLMRYLSRAGDPPDVSIDFGRRNKRGQQASSQDDPWKLWTIQVGFNGAYNGEESQNDYWVSSYVGAYRTSEDWKIEVQAAGSYAESNFDIDGETITSSKEDGSANGQVIRSLGNHFATGVFGSISTSSFRNTDLASNVSAAFEYAVFPYDESSRRELRLSYYVNHRTFEYVDTTVFNKISENVLHHELQLNLEMREPWGSAAATISASEYLTDFSARMTDLYRVVLSGFANVRLAKGLSLYATADVSRIRDQIFLRRRAASAEDVLLGRYQLPTDYRYSFTLGISFTFGSIYNNVVNPRFGSGIE